MGYFRQAVKGVSWTGGFRLISRFFAIARIAILARILVPKEFGIFGIASLVLAFLEVLTETGINIFLVQGEGEIKEYVDTAWIVSILRGIVIGLLIFLLSPLIATFFNSPESLKILRFISLVPPLRGFINPAVASFQKKLQFNKEFFFKMAVYSTDAVISIIVAFITKSAVSLVWGLIAGVVVEIAASFAFIKPRPKLAFEKEKVTRVISRGKWVTGAWVFNYLFHQGDDAVVGKLLSTSSLGLYQMAYKISTLPITEVADVTGRVTFPVYGLIKGDRKRLKKAFVKTTLAISAVVIPFALFLFVFAKPVVFFVLGQRWLEIVPALKVLSVFGAVSAVTGSSSALFLAVKKQEYVTLTTFVSVSVLAITIIPLVRSQGILGASYSALFSSLVATPFVVFLVAKIFKPSEKGV